jgi:site-specific DNA-methyltransferase (adenine-specific)
MLLADLPYGMTANKWDSHIPLESLWSEYWRVLKPHGIVALTASQPFSSVLVSSCIERFRHELIWRKNRGSNFASLKSAPMKEHESVLIFSRGKWTYNRQMQERAEGGKTRVQKGFVHRVVSPNYNVGGEDYAYTLPALRVPSSVQVFNCEVGLHPTQKPVSLFSYLIRTYTNPGDLVLDNAAGSCTTAIACMREGRDYLCIEKEGEYVQIGQTRVEHERATTQEKVS